MRLGAGIAPVAEMRQAKVPVGLGGRRLCVKRAR
jgi:cytosine/adenosine deaminase-related metal-dependent hydrolase